MKGLKYFFTMLIGYFILYSLFNLIFIKDIDWIAVIITSILFAIIMSLFNGGFGKKD